MYTRELRNSPEKIIHNGKPEFGTYEGYPKALDIRDVRLPFGTVPLPKIITNFRIKSSIMFFFNIGSYIGTVELQDQKIFGYVEVVFWSKETQKKYVYRAFMGPRRRFIPHNMESGFSASFNKHRYIRISWDHKRDRISLIFNLKGDAARPSAQAAFLAHFKEPGINEVLTVVPAPTKSRCWANYSVTPTIRGSLSLSKTKTSSETTMEDTTGQAILSISRVYHNLYSHAEAVFSTGISDGKHFSFEIFSTQENQVDTDKVNSNFIAVDGVCTPLPPVTITHPFGLKNKWIIQDFENMVDLTFTPSSDHFRDMTFLIFHAQIHTILGTFEGFIKTKGNETITLHNFEGIAKNQMMRL